MIRLSTLASALSVLLCAAALLAAIWLWAVSYHAARSALLSHYDSTSPSLAGRGLAAEVACGRLILTCEDVNLGDDPHPQPDKWEFSCFTDAEPVGDEAVEADQLWRFRAYWYRFGFEYSDWTAMGTRDRCIAVPMWFISGALACALVIGGGRQHARRVGKRGGHCGRCGYDL